MAGVGQKHIIRTQAVEINFVNGSDGLALQVKLSELVHEKLLQSMEQLFDEFGKDCVFSFDALNVDCGTLSPRHWEEELVFETLRRLREQLLAANKNTDGVHSRRPKLQHLFLFYAEHAYLPWNNDIVSLNELEEVELDETFMEKLQLLIQAGPKVARRLVNSFSESFIKKIIQRLREEKNVDISTVVADDFMQDIKRKEPITQERILDELCNHGTNIQTNKADKEKEVFAERNTAETEEEAIYISNAGLVILHPFLDQLFEKCGLIREKEWLDSMMSPCTASIMLQFLVWGTDNVAELNPVLDKILCGLEVRDTITNDEGLPDSVKTECEILLTEVISHWRVLKNTGTEAFRETFLQRSGKLVRIENGWLLQVEQKSLDVLLSALPWGIGTIKLPWMKDILYVEWA